jgi:predicted nucleic acid-binding protein
VVYLDTSALYKLVIDEQNSVEFRQYVQNLIDDGFALVSSILAETELKRIAQRDNVPLSTIEGLLSFVNLIEISKVEFIRAGNLSTEHSKSLRSLDALHIASAELVKIDFVITFDNRQALVFKDLGYKVHQNIFV